MPGSSPMGVNVSRRGVEMSELPDKAIKLISSTSLKKAYAGTGVAIMPITLARAVYKYQSDVSGDLNFDANDIIEIVNWEDENWIHGKIGKAQGMFPSNYVEILSLPTFNASRECLLLATKNFDKDEDRDLAIKSGDILVGLRQEDANWWYARKLEKEGIIPVTHVRWLTGSCSEVHPKPINKSDIPKPARALASSDLKGQIDGELSFNAGDQVEIVRVVDDVFCEGICHGEYGIFPLHVVRILEPENFSRLQNWCKEMNSTYKKASSLTYTEKPKNGEVNERSLSMRSRTATGCRSFTSETASTPDVQVEAYGKAIASFVGENSDELTFVAGDLVKLICHLDSDWTFGELTDGDGHSRRGIFPTRFVDIIVDCPYDTQVLSASSEKSEVESVYGIVKYNFYGDRSDDLHISKGDRVRLVRWVDENWCEAEDIDGNVGQCPTSYLDIQNCQSVQLSSTEFSDPQNEEGIDPIPTVYVETQPQTADEKREKFSFASCTNLSLDEAIANEMRRAKVTSEKPQSPIPIVPLRKYHSIEKQRPLSYHDPSSLESGEAPKPVLRKKPAPPRPLMPETLASSSKPVPRRPVPPRPVPNMPDTGEKNDSVVADLQKRIVSIEGDIKELTEASENTLSDVQDTYSEEAGEESIAGSLNSLRQDLKFYQDKLNEVTGNPLEEEVLDEMRKKRAFQRANVMKELVSTEEIYLRDLEVVHETFNESSNCKAGVDVGMLFGNLQDVIALSRRFLDTLKHVSSNDGSIGDVFLTFREEMVQVYVEYCKNHEDAVKYLMRGDTLLNNYVLDGLSRMQEKHSVLITNLDALIIKPVQRVLKYPLLLNELLRSTEETSSDHAAIAEAVISMTEAVKEINELKRRKDLVQKYLRPQSVDSSSSISLAHGMHTLKKKSARLSQRLSSTFGFKSRTIDDEFNREEARFRNCEKCIKVFLRDVQSHCDALKESINLHTSLCSDLFDFCADSSTDTESESRTFLDAYIRAMDSFKNTYNIRIESRVLTPLYKLQSLFQGPNKLIKKRYDKLLDYDNMMHTVKKAKDSGQCSRMMTESLDQAEKIYEAMNDQLKEELPILNQLSSRLLHECIGNFVQIATQLADNMLLEMRPVLQTSPMLTENNIAFRDIVDVFVSKQSALIERIARFSFAPRNSKSETSSRFVVEETSQLQTAEHRRNIIDQYAGDSVYVALQNTTVNAGDPNDLGLALREGDVVGVIKRAHPMGISGHWFVDNGFRKGFAPSNVLNLYSHPPPYSFNTDSTVDKMLMDAQSTPTTVWYVNLDEGTFTDAGSNGLNLPSSHIQPSVKANPEPASYYEDIDAPPSYDDITQLSQSPTAKSPLPVQTSPPVMWYRALYPFEARNANELSLVSGQMIQVIQRHDYSGNKEWWLVQADKKQGYVPSYYVQPL